MKAVDLLVVFWFCLMTPALGAVEACILPVQIKPYCLLTLRPFSFSAEVSLPDWKICLRTDSINVLHESEG